MAVKKTNKNKKGGWNLLRILEVLAVVGSIAAVALKMFGSNKGKKKTRKK